MRNRFVLALLVMLSGAIPAHAGFDELLVGLEDRLGSPTTIPMFGLIRFAVRVVSPKGVHDLQLAVFEGKGSLDPAYADQLIRARVGKGYTPLVRVRSRREGEWSFVYAKPLRELVDLIVMTNDGGDTTLVRMVVNPDLMAKFLDEERREDAIRTSTRARARRPEQPSPPSASSPHPLQ